MGKLFMYTGGAETNLIYSDPSVLKRGKVYEAKAKVLIPNKPAGLLFDEGFFSEDHFVEILFGGELISTEVMKQTCFAKAVLYGKDMRNYVGQRMRLYIVDADREIATLPVQKIEQVYGNIYKIETENSVYITEVQKRTVG